MEKAKGTNQTTVGQACALIAANFAILSDLICKEDDQTLIFRRGGTREGNWRLWLRQCTLLRVIDQIISPRQTLLPEDNLIYHPQRMLMFITHRRPFVCLPYSVIYVCTLLGLFRIYTPFFWLFHNDCILLGL